MRSQHIWTSRDEEGRKREVRVTKFGGQWKFQAKFRDELEWTYYEVPLVEDLRELREIIFRKYQRRRVSAEDLAAVDTMLRDHERVQKLSE
ncbi:MAG TPA: hypothetical protein VGK72_04105 [Chthoniobacterales bacterium]|jgi:hypothetical protein